jgi:hypothetical protein
MTLQCRVIRQPTDYSAAFRSCHIKSLGESKEFSPLENSQKKILGKTKM